jgi:hypothetical protein
MLPRSSFFLFRMGQKQPGSRKLMNPSLPGQFAVNRYPSTT